MQKTITKIKLVNSEYLFNSIKAGKPFWSDLKPFTEVEIQLAIGQFIEDEEYEKCAFLRDFISSRFDHKCGYQKPITF